jgi:hypothetical protein
VIRTAVGMCSDSLGPWAFDPGPRTPVARIWAAGNRAANHPMKGIVPPSPIRPDGWPKQNSDAWSMADANQATSGGAAHPPATASPDHSTTAP